MKPFSRLTRYEMSKMTLREIADSQIYEINPEHFKNSLESTAPQKLTPGHTFGTPRPWRPLKKSKRR
jgi:hypothetical protein